METAFLGISHTVLTATLVSIVVAAITALATSVASAPLRYLVDSRLQRAKAKTDFEYDQRRKLRAEIGAYHGRLLESATSLNYRLVNLAANWNEGWLRVNGDYARPLTEDYYYFPTTIYRFMAFAALANRFERAAIFIDSRIAEENDQRFVLYVKAMRWALTDVALFAGLEYDISTPTDHFFTDHLRRMCATFETEDENTLDLHSLEELLLAGEHELKNVLAFFDGMEPGLLRWDRLMAFQLLLMAFINTFGYDMQKSDQDWFDRVARQIERPQVASNLQHWLPKLGLGTGSVGKVLSSTLARRAAVTDESREATTAEMSDGAEPQA
jgi:hypothetical protein